LEYVDGGKTAGGTPAPGKPEANFRSGRNN
jgi:hypothetical protein